MRERIPSFIREITSQFVRLLETHSEERRRRRLTNGGELEEEEDAIAAAAAAAVAAADLDEEEEEEDGASLMEDLVGAVKTNSVVVGALNRGQVGH